MRPRLSTRDKAHLSLLAAVFATDMALLYAVTRKWWRA